MSNPPSSRAAWHLRMGAVVAAWALALVAATIAHPFLPESRWLLIHLLTLGVLTNSILVWSWHFCVALLRIPVEGTRPGQVRRLVAFNASAVAVVAGVVHGVTALLVIGGIGVGGAVLAHGRALFMAARRALPSRFTITVRYYVAAAALLCAGVAAGVVMGSTDRPETLPDRLFVAHVILNLVGWVGLSVLGTLVTLWPTMLRTRIPDGAERSARTLLLPLAGGIAVAAASAALGILLLTAAGLVVALAAGALLARPQAGTATRGMADPGGAQALAGLAWFAGSLLTLLTLLATAGSWAVAAERLAWLTPALLVGFAAQVLTGALTFLLPVVLGGGPNAVRTTGAVLARGWALRLVIVNVGLLVCLLPVPSMVRVAVSALVFAAAAALLPLAIRAAVVARRLRRQGAGDGAGAARIPLGMPGAGPQGPVSPTTAGRSPLGLAAAGLSAVVLASAVGVALDPASAGVSAGMLAGGWQPQGQAVSVEPTGRTTTAEVSIEGMRFVPDVLEVPLGDRLVVVLNNTGDDRHDLVLETGRRTARLAPGRTARLDAGIIGGPVEGWCSLPGHRSMGMTLTIRPTGVTGEQAADDGAGDHAAHQAAITDDAISDAAVAKALNATPEESLRPWDARLEPAPTQRLHRVRLEVTEQRQEVAPGIAQTRWTFGGTAPGPVLRGRVGDVFEITLVNDGSLGHSIDFHAGALAPQGPMRTIQPGESLVYRFTAIRAGVWMYHCSTMPMSMHIANGMFGAVIIDPPDLEPVDAEYVLVQSEVYLGAEGGTADAEAISAEDPDLVVFNGYARQYDHQPLPAKVGQRVRLWVLAAGPQRGSAFHVVGGQFDTVWSEGTYTLRPGRTAADASGASGGAQVLPLVPAQGGFVELSFPEPGKYPFVTHAMVDAERGAHGFVEVSAAS